MKKVTFVLPDNSNVPIGGYSIVFDYANYLAKKNYLVSIVFLYNMNRKNYLRALFDKFIDRCFLHVTQRSSEVSWFDLNRNISIYNDVCTPFGFPKGDAVIATAALTASHVKRLRKNRGKKFYFIQNYESEEFGNPPGYAEETYKLGLENIVISNELKERVYKETAIKPHLLPNFYNPSLFKLVNPIERRKNVVCLLNHKQESKRTELGIEVLKAVKKKIPDLQVELFGAYSPVCELEDWIHFTFKATSEQLTNEIYGKSKVYLLPSVLEGWVLTGMEAMASGALVISSRIGGIVDYANENNSVLIEPDDKDKFIAAVVDLLKNDEKRIVLSKQALIDMEKYRIEISGAKLEKILFGDDK